MEVLEERIPLAELAFGSPTLVLTRLESMMKRAEKLEGLPRENQVWLRRKNLFQYRKNNGIFSIFCF